MTAARPNMRYKIFGHFAVFVHTAEQPSDAEWRPAIEELGEATERGRLTVLVYTLGGAPNAAQRAFLNQATKGQPIRVAVVTSSVVARAAGIAIGWFNQNLRAFAPSDVQGALDHLELNDPERATLLRTLDELKEELSNARTSSRAAPTSR